MSLGGSSTPSTQTVTQKTDIPQYQQDYAISNENLANSIAARPYVPYTGQRVADFTPLQQIGIDQVAANATGAPLSGVYDAAGGSAAGAATSQYGQTLNPGSIAPWMSPYVQMALAPQLQAIARQGAETGKTINAGAAGAGAFGDARLGVQQGENDRNTAQLMSNTVGTGYQNAYDRAVAAAQGAFGVNAGQFNSDRTANLAGADEMARLAAAKYGYQQSTQNDLLATGKLQQDASQKGLDLAYQDFVNQYEYPQEMLNLRLATQAGSPYNTTRLTETPYSPTAQSIGALSALYGLVGRPAGGA